MGVINSRVRLDKFKYLYYTGSVSFAGGGDRLKGYMEAYTSSQYWPTCSIVEAKFIVIDLDTGESISKVIKYISLVSNGKRETLNVDEPVQGSLAMDIYYGHQYKISLILRTQAMIGYEGKYALSDFKEYFLWWATHALFGGRATITY